MAVITCTHCARQFSGQDGFDQHRHAAHQIVYECKFCDRKFPLSPSFKQHIHEMHFPCNLCKGYFNAKNILDVHVEKVHKQQNTHRCKGCSSTFHTELGLLEHMKAKGHGSSATINLNFHCRGCTSQFASDAALKEHMKAKNHGTSNNNNKEIINLGHLCREYSSSFSTSANLQEHMRATRHGDYPKVLASYSKAPSTQSTIRPSSLTNIVQNTLQTRCYDCLATFDTFAAWDQHNRSVHVLDCTQCDARFRGPVPLYQHQQTMHEVHCKCGFVCADVMELTSHNELHLLKCPKCPNTFDDFPAYLQHNEERHRFRCDQCPVILEDLISLSKHYLDSHALKCDKCFQPFDTVLKLLAHIAAHHQYRCVQCPAIFEDPRALEFHHHSGESFTCTDCEDCFESYFFLAQHLKAKHSFECSKCDSGVFKTAAALAQHGRVTHCIECTLCIFTFTDTNAFLEHFSKAHQGTAGRKLATPPVGDDISASRKWQKDFGNLSLLD